MLPQVSYNINVVAAGEWIVPYLSTNLLAILFSHLTTAI